MSNVTTTAPIAHVAIAAEAVVQTVATTVYVEHDNVLYSIKPKDFSILKSSANKGTLDRYFGSTILKHNPTCIFGTPGNRRSTEDERPIYNIGKLADGTAAVVKMPKIKEPAKVAKQTSGGKTIRVAQTGPQTIYLRLAATDARPYSLKPEQFAALTIDPIGIKYAARLKHNPTCVESDLVLGLISTELDRPMYELTATGMVQVFTAEQSKSLAPAVVAEPAEPAKVAKEKAPSKREAAAAKLAKAAK